MLILKNGIFLAIGSEEAPPTVNDLRNFVISNLRNRDIITNKFFERYFDRLHESGRLYYVFDSFDEIPAVLDEKENSILIRKLSEVIFKFIKGARQRNSQGILASRIFRKPTYEFQTKVVLEIRPFSEEKIIQSLKNNGVYNDELIKKLFSRIELYPIAKNPFTATLLSEYIGTSRSRLPESQIEIYDSFIENTINACSDRIEKKSLSKEVIISCCLAIANEMFTKYGLEAPINMLRGSLSHFPVDDVFRYTEVCKTR